MSSSCLSLSSSAVCPWINASVQALDQINYQNILLFDASIKNWVDSSNHSVQFNSYYSCYWDGSGLRYATTYACAERIFSSVKDCNSNNKISPICFSTCNIYLSSLSAIFENKTICPLPTNNATSSAKIKATRIDTINYVSRFCQKFGTNSTSNCVSSLPADEISCGFGSRSLDAQTFCQSKIDPCCSKLKNSTSQSTSSTPVMGLVIIAATAIVAFFIAVGVLISVAQKRKLENTKQLDSPGGSESHPQIPTRTTKSIFPRFVFSNNPMRQNSFNSKKITKHTPTFSMTTLNLSQLNNHHQDEDRVSTVTIPTPTWDEKTKLYNLYIPSDSSPEFPIAHAKSSGSGQIVSDNITGSNWDGPDRELDYDEKPSSEIHLFKVVHQYTPKLPDELLLKKDEILCVQEIFNDGW